MQRICNNIRLTLDAQGTPPHRQPSSSDLEFDTNSKIFVTESQTLNKMDPIEIADIFKHRHILVNKVEAGKRVEFNERGLSMLAPLDREVDIQCMCIPSTSVWQYLIRLLSHHHRRRPED